MPAFLFGLASVLLLVATSLPLSNVRHWSVRGLDFPRLQLACGLGALIVVLCVWLGAEGAPSPLWLLPLGAAFLYQASWIVRYSDVTPQEVPSASPEELARGPRVRLLISNVLMDNRESHRLIDRVLQMRPDVLLVVETDAWWQARLDEALSDWPHRIAHPLDNRYGMHLYSRLPLVNTHVDFLVQDDIPSIATRLCVAGGELRLHAIHPTPPAPGENERSTERDVELLTLADTLKDVTEPVIVTGDLNDVAWSRTTRLFCRVSGLLDPRVGRGMFNTFNAMWPVLRWPLDHVFVSEHYRVVEMQRLPDIGSDHFPVYIELVLADPRSLEPRPEPEEIDEDLEADTRLRARDVPAGEPSIGAKDVGAVARIA